MRQENNIRDFKPSDRVQLHPATDMWMRGARFGTVQSIGKTRVTLHIDALDAVMTMYPRDLLHVED